VRAQLLAVLGGSALALMVWMILHVSVHPPAAWLQVFVRSGCGPSDQAIEDASDAPVDFDLALMPLDAAAAEMACAITLPRLASARPWLVLFPEGWQCEVLKSHAQATYSKLELDDQPTPVYMIAGQTAVGWSQGRRAAVLRGQPQSLFE
jgi:hypothetical protein